MSLNKGDIVLVSFHFTDLSSTKLRPAVVLWSSNSSFDVTVCFVSSRILTNLAPEEFLITTQDAEFTTTGLKVDSKVRVSRIVTLERRLISRRIGKLGKNQMEDLNRVLVVTFDL